MCQALEVNHPSQDSFGIGSQGILQTLAVQSGQFDNDGQFEIHCDIDYGLPFDNDIGDIAIDVSPSSTNTSFDCLIDNSLNLINEENNFFDLINLNFNSDSNINCYSQQFDKKASSTLERGVSLFEEHLHYLKSNDNQEQSNVNETELNEIILPDELNNNDVQFILKERYKRNQNNESSKRSREARKRKFEQMNEEADIVEVENYNLKKKISQIELLIDKYNRKINEALKQNSKCH